MDRAHLASLSDCGARESRGPSGIAPGSRVEDYHHCLKTGCRIEERQVQSVDHLIRMPGLVISSSSTFVARARPLAP